MTSLQRQRFEEDGFVIVRQALSPAEVDHHAAAVDDAHRADAAAGRVAADGSVHRLRAVASCPPLIDLIDHPAVFPLVWSVLGWNVHMYHSHYNVHPPAADTREFRWRWHQDGGRQNVDVETDPRPRLSVWLAFWLTDVSQPGRGNMMVIPGSHTRNLLPGPPDPSAEWPMPEDAVPITVEPGDVLFFDRRLWHSRTPNPSHLTRKVAFFGYTYRWIRPRDDLADLRRSPAFAGLDPVRRQLLGEDDSVGDGQWGFYPDTVPLYVDLRERGLLDPDYRPHRRLYP